jgi:hypothetical protein
VETTGPDRSGRPAGPEGPPWSVITSGCWLYRRSGSLLGPWLGHLLVDALIFTVGWDLVR